MADPKRNAAIYYASDSYDPETKGINGRRVAGASFLKGFFRHAEVDEFVSLTKGDNGADEFAETLAEHRPGIEQRRVYQHLMNRMTPTGCLFYNAPHIAEMCWLRQYSGQRSFSICGITHTTSTLAIMKGFFDLRAGPQAEWDGIICPSKAVKAATEHNLSVADEFLRERFGAVPPRPQLPVIPLGINCDEFSHDAAAARAFRKRLNLSEKDIAVVTVARLTPYGKFDPGPLFIALQNAQAQLNGKRKLHFIACGVYADSHSQQVFETCAEKLMPDVSFTHLPGDDAVARRETLSGGDIFTFPIDNIQETFGLAPIEAMAAGLPLVVSDWDGMRDTVTPDVGIRIPTRTVQPAASRPEGQRYHSEFLTVAQFGNNMSMLTELDMGEMIHAFVTLALDDGLRARMGAAGKARAEQHYDWRAVIPQMQDFWAELNAIRETYTGDAHQRATQIPLSPRPMDLFASYPSTKLHRYEDRVFAVGDAAQLEVIFEARRYPNLGKATETLKTFRKFFAELEAQGENGATVQELAAQAGTTPNQAARCLMFFLKYGLAELRRD